MNANPRKGMTLIETTIAVAVFSVLTTLALSSVIDFFKLIAVQEAKVKTDQRGNLALNSIVNELSPAILPIFVKGTSGTLFSDIDNADWGFGGANGRAWLSNLESGMDNIAFVVPIDAQGVGRNTLGTGSYTVDYLDSKGRLQTGQTRGPDENYLGSGATLTLSPEYEFVVRDKEAFEPVSVLTSVDPGGFNSAPFERVANPTASDWAGINDGGGWPDIASFMAIRFVPLLDGGSPVILEEATSIRNKTGAALPTDFDGDGATDGRFQVGMLQLLYSGGRFPVVRGNTIATENVPQITVPLTPYSILRAANESQRTPIFRLEGLTVGSDSTVGYSKVAVRFLMLDGNMFSEFGDRVEDSIYRTDGSISARWYQTTVTLRNMERN